MKNTLRLVSIAILALAIWAAPGGAGEEGPWFDMVNCGFCKNLGSHAELLKHMTWKHYDLSNGIMSVTTVPGGSMDEYKTVCSLMEETGKKLAAGEEIPICRSCQTYGSFMAKGLKPEMVFTDFGSVRLSISSDPEVVAGLHAWAATTRSEMEKMAPPEVTDVH